jgi:hypothetical protein
MVAGAPRTVSPPPDEMIQLGKDMLEWVIKNEPMHLSQWYCGVKHFEFKDWEAMRKLPEFVTYYEQALSTIGLQYLKKDSNIEPSLKQRWARVYFKDLRNSEDSDEKDKEEREFKRKLALIEHQAKQEQAKLVSPYEEIHDLKHENMIMKDENRKLRERLADKS